MSYDKKDINVHLNEISRRISGKRLALLENIDELVSVIQHEYESLLSQKEVDLALLKNREIDCQKDLLGVLSLKNNLLSSLESETHSHQKSLEFLALKDNQIDHLNQEILNLNERLAQHESQSKSSQEELLKLQKIVESQNIEILELKDRISKFRTIADKGAMVYAKTLKQSESEKLLKTLIEQKENAHLEE